SNAQIQVLGIEKNPQKNFGNVWTHANIFLSSPWPHVEQTSGTSLEAQQDVLRQKQSDEVGLESHSGDKYEGHLHQISRKLSNKNKASMVLELGPLGQSSHSKESQFRHLGLLTALMRSVVPLLTD
ncbi:hypothetical protein J0S82_008257, partial [Galemys pyrenaicus]